MTTITFLRNWEIHPYTPVSRRDAAKLHEWGGGLTRQVLQAVYTIVFLCLLHVDEVLKIKMSHIEMSGDGNQMTLTLPYHKTHQFGGMHHLFALSFFFVITFLNRNKAFPLVLP